MDLILQGENTTSKETSRLQIATESVKEIDRTKTTEQLSEGTPERPGRKDLSGARAKDGKSWSYRELGK